MKRTVTTHVRRRKLFAVLAGLTGLFLAAVSIGADKAMKFEQEVNEND